MDTTEYARAAVEYERPGLPYGVAEGRIELSAMNRRYPRFREDIIAVLTDTEGPVLIPKHRIIRILMGERIE
jgi:hypothetical protein